MWAGKMDELLCISEDSWSASPVSGIGYAVPIIEYFPESV